MWDLRQASMMVCLSCVNLSERKTNKNKVILANHYPNAKYLNYWLQCARHMEKAESILYARNRTEGLQPTGYKSMPSAAELLSFF